MLSVIKERVLNKISAFNASGIRQSSIYSFVSFYILFLFVIRYILYKAPGEKIPDPQNPQEKIYKREIKYIYIDSTQKVDMVPGTRFFCCLGQHTEANLEVS